VEGCLLLLEWMTKGNVGEKFWMDGNCSDGWKLFVVWMGKEERNVPDPPFLWNSDLMFANVIPRPG